MATISNEAEELHRMCMKIRHFDKPGSTLDALSNLFGVEPESPEYFFFIAAIRLRFKRFLNVAEVAVPNERHRSNLRAAVTHLQSFTDNRYWQASWPDTRKNVFLETHLLALDMSGGGLMATAPVTVLSEDELNVYVGQLKETLKQIEFDSDFVSQMVATSINTAVQMLERFDLYGSAAIGEKLFEAHAIVKQAAEIAPSNKRQTYRAAAAIVGVVLSGLLFTDGVFTAVENFYTRANSAAESLLLSSPPEQKLLSPPNQDEADGGSKNQDELGGDQIAV